jgi:hypothetical protein
MFADPLTTTGFKHPRALPRPLLSLLPGLALAACHLLPVTCAADDPSAAGWAGSRRADLAAIATDDALAATAQDPAAVKALLAAVKPAYASDGVALTRIAALSQFVGRPAGAAHRAAWADALLAAAKGAEDAYVALALLDQLRWCGLASQADAVRALAAAAPDANVKATADLLARTLAALPEAPLKPANKYAEFSAALDALPPAARAPRLLAAADDPDLKIAGLALARARTGAWTDTPQWCAKLAAAQDPARKAMLLDLLGERGDNAAQGAVAARLTDADNAVAAAAHRAFLRLNKTAYAAHLPTLLKTLPPERLALTRDSLRQLDTPLVQALLTHAYPGFSATGKLIALELFKERRIAGTAPHALAALDNTNEETAIAGYRLLREVAGKEHADALVAKTLASTGRVTPEAQTTLAAAARRDPSGAYAAALAKALAAAPDAQKPIALEAAARLGGAPLLKAVEAASASPNAEIATAAVRALAAWPDAAALPALTRIAAEDGPDAKRRALAQRGLDKFKTETNVALKKTVTADTPAEGNNVPANLVDGTIEKQWHAHGTPASAVIDLAGDYTLGAMHVTFYHADGRAYTFKLELSTDNKTWKEVAGNAKDVKPATADGLRLTFAPTPARYARLTVLKNTANAFAHVAELELFTATQP